MNSEEKHLITQKKFAELCGVKPQAITAIKKRLGEALEGRKINLKHPNAQEYLNRKKAQHEAKMTASQVVSQVTSKVSGISPPTAQKSGEKKFSSVAALPKDLESLTLGEIVIRFGSLEKFKLFVKAQDDLTAYNIKKTKWEGSRKKLIDKRLHAMTCFEALEILSQSLLKDIPQNLSQRVVAIAQGESSEAAILVRKEMVSANSKALNFCRDTIIGKLELLRDESLKRELGIL